ncbi:MAG: beta-lactamase family protein, partial [Gemmatimonadetes bacterium]|nr:beta-lactamase family protein [Gemmatimonadota bacterium]
MTDFADLIVHRLQQRIEAGAMSAASVRVERRGEPLLDWTGGRLGFEPGAGAATPDSVFLIASITKPMTCCGVAKLVERGLIDLDEPVARYVP